MDTAIIVSVRIPVLPSPKSPPMSRMFRRSWSVHGEVVVVTGGAVVGVVATVLPSAVVTGGVVTGGLVVVGELVRNTEDKRSYCTTS
jgi:hypothetical protein